MKRNLLLAAALVALCGTVAAATCAATASATAINAAEAAFSQTVRVYNKDGNNWGAGTVVSSDNACSSYTIEFGGSTYRVSNSDRQGYRYMFFDKNRTALYFNM